MHNCSKPLMKSGKKQRNGNSITIGIDPTNCWSICHQPNTNLYPDSKKPKNKYLFKLINAVENSEAYRVALPITVCGVPQWWIFSTKVKSKHLILVKYYNVIEVGQPHCGKPMLAGRSFFCILNNSINQV
jgi:hypothetical protein